MLEWADLIIPGIWLAAIAAYLGYRVGLYYGRLEAKLNRSVEVRAGDVHVTLSMHTVDRLLDRHGLIAQPKGIEKLNQEGR